MQDAALVHVVQRERQLHQPLQDLLLREGLARHRDAARQVGTRTVPVMRGHTVRTARGPGSTLHAALCRWHVQHAGRRGTTRVARTYSTEAPWPYASAQRTYSITMQSESSWMKQSR